MARAARRPGLVWSDEDYHWEDPFEETPTESHKRILRSGFRYRPLDSEFLATLHEHSEVFKCHRDEPCPDRMHRGDENSRFLWAQAESSSDLVVLAPASGSDSAYIERRLGLWRDAMDEVRPPSPLLIRKVTLAKERAADTYEADYLRLLILDAMRLTAHHVVRATDFFYGPIKPILIVSDLCGEEADVVLDAASGCIPDLGCGTLAC
jgi:hypothetical protein